MTVSLKRRLDRVMLNRPSHPNEEQMAAHSELISYLDQLASRKSQGDVAVQQEIDDFCLALAMTVKPRAQR